MTLLRSKSPVLFSRFVRPSIGRDSLNKSVLVSRFISTGLGQMQRQGDHSWKDHGVTITLPPQLVASVLNDFVPYTTWRSTLAKSLEAQKDPSHPFHHDPYQLKSIDVQACDFFSSSRLGFLKLKAGVYNGTNERIPGAVFMRGGSVAMLIVLRPNDSNEEYVILTVQPRIPAGSLSFVELPAGMIDDSGTFGGAAAKEIKEETGLDIKEDELTDMTKLAIAARDDDDSADEVHLQHATYPSPGGCDEFIPIFLVRKELHQTEIDALKGKLTGLRDHGEKITLKICKLSDLWKVAAGDGKTLAAIALYEGLKREGKI